MDNHDFCRGRLKLARHDAEEACVQLPNIRSYKMHEENYAVYAGAYYYEYNACCAFEARASCIYEIIDNYLLPDKM